MRILASGLAITNHRRHQSNGHCISFIQLNVWIGSILIRSCKSFWDYLISLKMRIFLTKFCRIHFLILLFFAAYTPNAESTALIYRRVPVKRTPTSVLAPQSPKSTPKPEPKFDLANIIDAPVLNLPKCKPGERLDIHKKCRKVSWSSEHEQ